jgi:AAA+ superfamily predicted ATPase
VLSKWAGEPSKNVARYARVAAAYHPAIIIIDDAEQLLTKQKPEDNAVDTSNEFKTAIDGIEGDYFQVCWICMTNYPGAIEKAVRNRFHPDFTMEPPSRNRLESMYISMMVLNKEPWFSFQVRAAQDAEFNCSHLTAGCHQRIVDYMVKVKDGPARALMALVKRARKRAEGRYTGPIREVVMYLDDADFLLDDIF